MRALLDTHFLLWILTRAERLGEFPWLDEYRPWGISPISLLELQYLAEIGRLEMDTAGLVAALDEDGRFIWDDPPLAVLISAALPLSWTRDPFDRLLAAHSATRRIPLCTIDRTLLDHHPLIVRELR